MFMLYTNSLLNQSTWSFYTVNFFSNDIVDFASMSRPKIQNYYCQEARMDVPKFPSEQLQ